MFLLVALLVVQQQVVIQAKYIKWESRNGRLYANGKDFKFKGINWFGFDTKANCLHGLWGKTSIDGILQKLKNQNFNAIRVPLNLQATINNPIPKKNYLNKEAWLKGKHYLTVMQALVYKAAQKNMLIVLDNQRLTPGNDIKPLWYESWFPEWKVKAAWRRLAEKFCSQWNVVAADVKNEPHGMATWGDGDWNKDWSKGAARLGNDVLKKCPRWMVWVEGIDETAKGEPWMHTGFWGSRLEGVHKHPVKLSNPKRLVYSPHVYGPSVHPMVEFKKGNYPYNLDAIWEQQWAKVPSWSHRALVVGEWGGTYDDKDAKYQQEFMKFIKKKGFGAFYWCVNPNSGDTKGLFLDDWKSFNWGKMRLLQEQPFTKVQDV